MEILEESSTYDFWDDSTTNRKKRSEQHKFIIAKDHGAISENLGGGAKFDFEPPSSLENLAFKF